MSSPKHRVRRATLEDLPALKSLWDAMRFPAIELEKQLTDFQVVVDETEQVCGCVAFQMRGKHACIHSETYSDFGIAETSRVMFWTRFQSLATNHGLVCLWTREVSPFWSHNGFLPAEPAALEKLPAPWDRTAPGWLMLKLRDEAAVASLEKEFAMFVESEKGRSEQSIEQLRMIKTVVVVLAMIGCAALLGWGIYIFLHRAQAGSPPL